MESPYRWPYLSAMSLGVGSIGAMTMIAYGWSHGLARVWFYAWFIVCLFCIAKAIQALRAETQSPHHEVEAPSPPAKRPERQNK